MSFAELLLISIGLAMDAFAVSLTDGATRCGRRRALFIALLFGLFQAAMPIAGYFICSGFAELISAYDHYVALLALGFIGGKMIIKAPQNSAREKQNLSVLLSRCLFRQFFCRQLLQALTH